MDPCARFSGDKGQLRQLNDKLSGYIQRMRDLGRQADGVVGSQVYHDAIRTLEQEIANLKNLYESELEKLRRMLDACNQEKSALACNNGKNQGLASDLQARLNIEADNARKAQDALNNLQRALAAKDKEIADLTAACRRLQGELDKIMPDYNRLNRDSGDYQRRLENECKLRMEAENRAKMLGDKANFGNNARDQELADLKERLKACNNLVSTLENKIRQLSNSGGGNDLANLLQKLRDGTAAEIRRYQNETEQCVNATLGSLKHQMDEDARGRAELARQKAELDQMVVQLRARIGDLEGSLNGCQQENRALKDALNRERSQCQGQTQDLERRMREMQGQLMNSAKNCGSPADVCLRTEIQTYKTLLEEEDQRMRGQGMTPRAKTAYASPRISANYTGGGIHSYNQSASNNWNATPRQSYTYGSCGGACGGGGGGQNQFPTLAAGTGASGYSKVTHGSVNAYRPGSSAFRWC